MAKKTDEPAVTISDRCIICHQIFVKKHPKDNRCICEKCADKIAEMIGVKDGRKGTEDI